MLLTLFSMLLSPGPFLCSDYLLGVEIPLRLDDSSLLLDRIISFSADISLHFYWRRLSVSRELPRVAPGSDVRC